MAKTETNSEVKPKKNKQAPESNEKKLLGDLLTEFKPLTDILDKNAEEIKKDLDAKPKKKSSKK